MKGRVLSDFITGIRQLSAETEAPEHFWIWCAIHTINAAMERKTWIEYGMDRILPNLYIILSAPPGKCRKGGPIALSRRLLRAIKLNVSADSTSKQALTMELCDAVKTVEIDGKPRQHSPIAIISKELSSLLAVDAKQMIEFLTDGFDYHEDVWEYKVKHSRSDKIYGPCIDIFAATTPSYVANNIPYEAFGAGFFSRVIFVVGTNKKKRVPIPPEPDRKLLETLAQDLNVISHLKGKFFWTKDAIATFENWYNKIDRFYETIKDERFHGFIERMHIHALKVAMALSVSKSSDLILEEQEMRIAIALIEERVNELPDAFGGLGRSEQSVSMHEIIKQLTIIKEIKSSELFAHNWRNINKVEFDSIIDSMYKMNMIDLRHIQGAGGRPDAIIKWKGEK